MTTLRSETVDGVPVLCEKCGTAIAKDSEDSARSAVRSHNSNFHDGDSVAVVVLDRYDVDVSMAKNTDRFARQIMDMVNKDVE